MKPRIALAVFAFVTSLVALVVSVVHLAGAIDAFSPLDPTHYGPLVPGVTKMVLEDLPSLPLQMGMVAALTTVAALYFWRSSKPVETKTFAVALLASLNLFFAAWGPLWFLDVFFVLPKVMNSG